VKSILGLIGGGDRDSVILRTALAAAVPLSAHLDFLHIHVTAGNAARYNRVEFAMGTALHNAMEQLETKAKTYSEVAADNVRAFCAGSEIAICENPTGGGKVTASYREERDAEIERLIFHARHSDLVVMGRAKQTQGLSPDTLEQLILNCGRPVLLAATAAPQTLTGTVMVCWNESSHAARTLAVAMPYLIRANRVMFTSVAQGVEPSARAVYDIAERLARNGVAAEAQLISLKTGGISKTLTEAAADCNADLLVMGAYGHSRVREMLFGSCTEALIHEADRPILLMH
jgi:nucleotide-binding universal stress UspA family protein